MFHLKQRRMATKKDLQNRANEALKKVKQSREQISQEEVRLQKQKEVVDGIKKKYVKKKEVVSLNKVLSVGQIAKVLGINRGYLYNKVNGARPLSVTDKVRLRAFFRVLREHIEEVEKQLDLNGDNESLNKEYPKIKESFEKENR